MNAMSYAFETRFQCARIMRRHLAEVQVAIFISQERVSGCYQEWRSRLEALLLRARRATLPRMQHTSSMPQALTHGLTALLALSCGVLAANLYYAQPLTAQISSSLHIDRSLAGLTVMLTQIGYGLGVFFIVPLGDLIENRRLILSLIGLAIAAVIAAGLATSLAAYLSAALFVGLGACAVQIIVPFAAHFSPPERRGQVVGTLMSGLMMGIMLSRPIAGIVTDLSSWHSVFFASAAFMTVTAAALYMVLPRRLPEAMASADGKTLAYPVLIASMGQLIVRYAVLRRRAFYQALMFASFCLFWTASPLLLAGPDFGMSQTGIAIFALVGVAGAIFAPIAGKLADAGWSRAATVFGICAGAAAFLMTSLVPLGSRASLILLTIAAVLLDAGVSGNLVVGQRAIFALPGQYRGRLNGIYIATIFVGGALGSFVGAWAYARGGWPLASWIGFGTLAVNLLIFASEPRGSLSTEPRGSS